MKGSFGCDGFYRGCCICGCVCIFGSRIKATILRDGWFYGEDGDGDNCADGFPVLYEHGANLNFFWEYFVDTGRFSSDGCCDSGMFSRYLL